MKICLTHMLLNLLYKYVSFILCSRKENGKLDKKGTERNKYKTEKCILKEKIGGLESNRHVF